MYYSENGVGLIFSFCPVFSCKLHEVWKDSARWQAEYRRFLEVSEYYFCTMHVEHLASCETLYSGEVHTHDNRFLVSCEEEDVRTYIPERHQKTRRWTNNPAERQTAFRSNRRRVRGDKGRRLNRWRSKPRSLKRQISITISCPHRRR